MIAKRKREEDEEKRKKIDNGISKYFSAKNAAMAPKAKVRSPVTPYTQQRTNRVSLSLLPPTKISWMTC